MMRFLIIGLLFCSCASQSDMYYIRSEMKALKTVIDNQHKKECAGAPCLKYEYVKDKFLSLNKNLDNCFNRNEELNQLKGEYEVELKALVGEYSQFLQMLREYGIIRKEQTYAQP